ncbi:5'-methylthioadenosine/S-adenosylhomocysteine nucleosidase [Streptomyces acidiscabies]|uniref:5'-methylthioadenosine/S-adenosylhomocysteine nucleosidase n=1 Tax=Streptomyces acidiscabies TaxID=42234 RepID=A0AAP6EGT6_9ACTN|nr:5'-methylthioadenosine/S-adenosylhomocysteine nucleosidase [Streptomyces acidiscabies]MBZ3909116.1 5'-methylthioadenosine/S-adenosylhomocysteine nucleosidase [Streptomyces acidiscabies]MDX2961655.1 5'-methylthioadenosine/S-adenosylhomocysteine nucleosidase [Streptomyces acidiscabies]MDX3016476.1 5'-methylthioadenosine/S-adenosylhomocysteine nucleosidase [Streptomyces acidiscabies]MDX3788618.1 5'-methylthioadenosine/S-adenosylhomocysteine nucleosidase [Streptomyces acidiscabies]GAQ52353.1 5'
MPDGQPLVAIITGLPLEYEAVRSLLTGLGERMVGIALSVEVGELPDSAWQVALADVSSTHTPAAILIEDVVRQLRPDALLFIGIAGGLKDTLEVGDLVVATKIYAFQGGKQTPEGFYARPQSWHSSYRMTQTARSALRDLPGVHFGAMVASDVVLNDERASLLDQLKRSYNDALAVEMEGAGVAHVAHLTTGLEMLTVRGISDVADRSKIPGDPRRAQSLAAARAASAAAAILRKLGPPPRFTATSQATHIMQSAGDISIRGNTFFNTPPGKITADPPPEDN